MPEQTSNPNEKPNPAHWVTKTEIARHLHCTPRYINKLMGRKVLPYVKVGGMVRFDLAECDRALEIFKTGSLADGPQRIGRLRASTPLKPASTAPPAPSRLCPPEQEVRPVKHVAPQVRLELFSSLADLQGFLATLKTAPPTQDTHPSSDQKERRERRGETLIMVLTTNGTTNQPF